MKKVLAGKRLYLSGPIEHGSKRNWRVNPKKVLSKEFGIEVYDPFSDPKQQWAKQLKEAQAKCDYESMQRIAKCFVRKDLCWVDRSDILIARLPYKVPTCGSHHEIINSNNSKKPTLIVCPQGAQYVPLWYYGFIPTEFMFGSWKALYAYLREVNEGKHIDNDRWAFIYDLI